MEDSLGQEQVPTDLPPDDELIAAGAAAVGAGAADAEALAALKGRCNTSRGDQPSVKHDSLNSVQVPAMSTLCNADRKTHFGDGASDLIPRQVLRRSMIEHKSIDVKSTALPI